MAMKYIGWRITSRITSLKFFVQPQKHDILKQIGFESWAVAVQNEVQVWEHSLDCNFSHWNRNYVCSDFLHQWKLMLSLWTWKNAPDLKVSQPLFLNNGKSKSKMIWLTEICFCFCFCFSEFLPFAFAFAFAFRNSSHLLLLLLLLSRKTRKQCAFALLLLCFCFTWIPCLKHGPRSLSKMRVNEYMKLICRKNLTVMGLRVIHLC